MIAENESEILSLAWNAYHTPLRYQDWWSTNSDLPEGMNLLLRIASGDVDLAESFCQANNINKKDLQEAATFFIRQAFFTQGASYYRIMGLNAQADQDQIKEHYRLLMRLFHPDRQQTQGAWTDSFAGRVNQAYNVLRRPELRQEYDSSLSSAFFKSSSALSNTSTFIEPSAIPFIPVKQTPARSSHVKYLPYVVMSGVSLLSVLFLFNAYFSNDYDLMITSQQDSGGITPEAYVKSNNQYRPDATIEYQAELSEALRDLAEDHELLKIPDKSNPETPEVEKITNLKIEEDIDRAIALSTKKPPSHSREVTKNPSSTQSKLLASVPAPATQQKLSTLAKSKPSKSNNYKRDKQNSEIHKSKKDNPIHSSPIRAQNDTLNLSNVARISSTYKQAANKKSTNTKTIQSAKAESNIQRNLVKPKTQSETEKKNIANLTKKPTPNFSERELRLLLGRFVSAYERGDLTTLMSLFTEQARAGGKRGKAKIRQDYKNLFANTHSRRISLSNIVWRQAGNFFRGDGQFRLRTSPISQQGSTQSSGKVSFEVEQQNGRFFIRGFYHQLGG